MSSFTPSNLNRMHPLFYKVLLTEGTPMALPGTPSHDIITINNRDTLLPEHYIQQQIFLRLKTFFIYFISSYCSI